MLTFGAPLPRPVTAWSWLLDLTSGPFHGRPLEERAFSFKVTSSQRPSLEGLNPSKVPQPRLQSPSV